MALDIGQHLLLPHHQVRHWAGEDRRRAGAWPKRHESEHGWRFDQAGTEAVGERNGALAQGLDQPWHTDAGGSGEFEAGRRNRRRGGARWPSRRFSPSMVRT